MTVRKLSFGELVAQTQQFKLDIARKLPDFEQLRAQTEQWKSDVQHRLTYDNLKAQSAQLKNDVTSLAVTSVTSALQYARTSASAAREYVQTSVTSAGDFVRTSRTSTQQLVRTSRVSLEERLRRAATSTKERLLWAARAYALVCFTLFYWLVAVPVTHAYVFAVDSILSIVDAVCEKADVFRFASEIVLSFLSAFQRSICWLLAYVRHREKCVRCSTRYVADNDIEIYGFVVPRSVNDELLAWLPTADDLVAPAFDFFVDLLLDVRPDNCGQLDHKNDRYECWVQDGGDKMRVMPARSNCPVAVAANVHRRIQQQRAALSKMALGLGITKES